MPEKNTPLTTEHLRIMREDLSGMRADIAGVGKRMDAGFADLKKRLARVEQTMVGLKRDEAETAAELTEHRHTLDRLDAIIAELRERLDKIEARAAH